ncbi:MAG: hypothetical protein M3680_35215 [Myxococcota bacterium]|nr:hypothetical protein [Myxococcota bacterium]
MSRAVLVLALLAGCTETVQLGSGRLSGLVGITLTAADTTLTVTDLTGPPPELGLVAIGTFIDGTTRDITSLVAWSVDDLAPGSFAAPGRYVASQAAGGHVVASARAETLEVSVPLHVRIELALSDAVFPPPVGADALFAPGMPVEVGGSLAPGILYPPRGALVPQDLARILFQLAPRAGTDAYRWRLDSDLLRVTVVSGSDRWQPDGALWALLAATHPGATVELVAEAASTASPGTIHASAPSPLTFSQRAIGGVLYHWSAATTAVMRGTLASETVGRLYPAAGDATCVGCHTVSRDGRAMALAYGDDLRTIELEDATPLLTTPLRPMGWATFSPTAELLVVADRGVLTLRDAVTGEPLGPNGGRVPLPRKASHPDWSPDGKHLVVTLTNDVTNLDVGSGSIARIAFVAGAWGATEVLVAGSPTSNNYFPRYSPDGRYIAYVNAAGPSRGAPTAELRLIRDDGGVHIPLAIASHRVGTTDDVPHLATTMPTWAPIEGDLAWLAFASARPYGAILPTSGLAQIWIAGLDLTRAAAGLDPSFAALWLPSQDVRVLNNNPIWAPHVQTPN